MSTENASAIEPGQDDRIMAALAHVTAILPMMGVIAPIVIWATQKNKSPFVGFQALQALVYQLVMVLAYFVGMGCYMCLAFAPLAMLLLPEETLAAGGGSIAMLMVLPQFAGLGIFLLGGLAFVIYGIVGAARVLQGKDFRYAVIGSRLERYLETSESSESAAS